MLLCLFLCRPPGLQPKLGFIVLLVVIIDLCIVVEGQIRFSHKRVSP